MMSIDELRQAEGELKGRMSHLHDFLRIDERTIQSLTSPFIRWSAQVNRGLIIDDVEFSEEMPFIPYAPVTQADANAFRNLK